MADSYEKLQGLIESLAAEGVDSEALGDFEALVVERIGRMRSARDRAIRDRETARLLPYGARPLAEKQHCHRATIYRRAERGRTLSHSLQPAATKPA